MVGDGEVTGIAAIDIGRREIEIEVIGSVVWCGGQKKARHCCADCPNSRPSAQRRLI
jgi:hypothetical protein